MKPILTTTFARKPEALPTTDAPMKIAVAYHDTTSLVKAIQFCDRFVQEYWEQFEIECTWWKFDFLRHPQIFTGAVAAACEADLILLSLPPDQKLAKNVERWIDEWLEQRQFRPGALVSLIPSGNQDEEPPAVEEYFENVARRGFMDYFPHHVNPVDRSEKPDTELEFTSRILDTLPEVQSTPRWGINE